MKLQYALLILTITISSCVTPSVVIQLTPEAPQGHYEMGREYISLINDSLIAELGFDGMHGDNLVFDFVVVNRTPQSLTINPSDFYYVRLDSAMADSSMLPPRKAIHPERIVLKYDDTLEAKADQKATNSILGFLDAGFGLIANTAAFVATEDPGYILDAVIHTVGTADYYVSRDQHITREISHIAGEKERVKNEIFRKTVVKPGEAAHGYVYFPGNPETNYYMFCFPVEEQLFQYVYRQRKVYQYH